MGSKFFFLSVSAGRISGVVDRPARQRAVVHAAHARCETQKQEAETQMQMLRSKRETNGGESLSLI